MNRRGWLKLLGLAPVVPVAAALPIFATFSRPDLYKMIMELEEKLNRYDAMMGRRSVSIDRVIAKLEENPLFASRVRQIGARR